ncbi:cob(I)alamin adenosyltransferase [Cetobacterium ceti]|uniref:Cob(I)alamin adenosyltransferase n=1 Tax=Cetobacterium ceti TaxID=180163 RepID=A0A1T4PUN4_9FUSO|nr:cob(I)yrinic acid a,c-diamide adenosyltransferase [Cetobacterium ceti]SJZ94648.1 cob(I)alamin adenosyltransferase [Cetobacterium ceti]
MKGYVHVYTGNGKGKTTASLGLAVRALGNNMKVYMGQFMKGQKYGELNVLEKLGVPVERFGTENCIISPEHVQEVDRIKAKNGYLRAKEILLSDEYDIVILDEICICPYFNLISTDEILQLIDLKPERTELILTGRYAPERVIERADLVTEMLEVKHYYYNGILARNGIER